MRYVHAELDIKLKVVFIYIPRSEDEPFVVLPYKEWHKNTDFVKPGTYITDVPPKILFTTQNGLHADKMGRAYGAQEELVDDAYLVSGTVFQHPKEHMGIVLVLLEGHHRTVYAAHNELNVNFKVSERQLEEDAKVWRITNLMKKYGGLVR